MNNSAKDGKDFGLWGQASCTDIEIFNEEIYAKEISGDGGVSNDMDDEKLMVE